MAEHLLDVADVGAAVASRSPSCDETRGSSPASSSSADVAPDALGQMIGGDVMPGWGRATGSSSDYFGIGSAGKSLGSSVSFSSLFFSRALVDATKELGKSLETAAKDARLDAQLKIAFNPGDLHDIKRISDNLVDVTFHINRTSRNLEQVAEHLANPEIRISPSTTTQCGIIGLAVGVGYCAGSTLKSLAEKYIHRSAQLNQTTDSAIAAASCALLAGSAYSIYHSGRLAGYTPQATQKRMRQQSQQARVFEYEEPHINNLQLILRTGEAN